MVFLTIKIRLCQMTDVFWFWTSRCILKEEMAGEEAVANSSFKSHRAVCSLGLENEVSKHVRYFYCLSSGPLYFWENVLFQMKLDRGGLCGVSMLEGEQCEDRISCYLEQRSSVGWRECLPEEPSRDRLERQVSRPLALWTPLQCSSSTHKLIWDSHKPLGKAPGK